MKIEAGKIYNIRNQEDWNYIIENRIFSNATEYKKLINYWYDYMENFCVRAYLNSNKSLCFTYCSVGYFKEDGYEIIEYKRDNEYCVELL